MERPQSWWDAAILLICPLPVFVFYWLFAGKYPVSELDDPLILMPYLIVGCGTLAYVVHWLDVVRRYPESKRDTWRFRYGHAELFGLGGIWLTFMAYHALGVFVVIWVVIDGLGRLLTRRA